MVRRARWTGNVCVWLLAGLALVARAQSPSEPGTTPPSGSGLDLVILTGAGGEQAYAERFDLWAS